MTETIAVNGKEYSPNEDLRGRRVNVPHSHTPTLTPTVDDEYGAWEVPTRADDFRVLSDLGVVDPETGETRAVTIDHVVDSTGRVTVEVNGDELAALVGGGD